MKLRKIIEEISEAKQAGYLYHVMDSDKFDFLLKNNLK